MTTPSTRSDRSDAPAGEGQRDRRDTAPETRAIDTAIAVIGGGVAGLWVLDALVDAGVDARLVESTALGAGQSICAQGIIHGGLKYTLRGLLTPAADRIREMPGRWRRSLEAAMRPDLGDAVVRADACHLWRTDAIASRMGMIGARAGLRVKPQLLAPDERPDVLAACPGTVARLDEPVLEVPTVLAALAAPHASRLAMLDRSRPIRRDERGRFRVPIRAGGDAHSPCELDTRALVLCAGAGNAGIRATLGLAVETMQRRPLHMVMVRGETDVLPELHGHCVDGARTRVTVTSSTDAAGRRVWQLGGQIAEDAVAFDELESIERAIAELTAVLPGRDWSDPALEWAAYRVDRAEAASGGARPDDAQVMRDGDVVTVWPTKLALAPRAAEQVLETIVPRLGAHTTSGPLPPDRPRPAVADPPWERATWLRASALA